MVSSTQNFTKMMTALEALSAEPTAVVDDQFQLTDKKWWSWTVLSLLCPFYALLGRDVYSHYRVQSVVEAIFKACEENVAVLKSDISLQERLLERITGLVEKTKGKQTPCFEGLMARLEALTVEETIPNDPVPGESPGPRILRASLPGTPAQVDPANFQMAKLETIYLEIGGMTEKQMAELKIVFNRLVPQCLGESDYTLRCVQIEGKNVLQKMNRAGEVVDGAEVPFPLEVVYKGASLKGQLQDVILLTGHCIKEGGQTKVFLAFSLFEGVPVAQKNYSGVFQRDILEYLRDHPSRGVVPIIGTTENHSFELLCDQNLTERIAASEGEVPPLSNRLKIAEDILRGVAAFHRIKGEMPNPVNNTETLVFDVSHADITTSNVLVNVAEDHLTPAEAFLTDWSGHPRDIGGTPGYKDPSLLKLYMDLKKSKDESESINKIIIHNAQSGQKSDVWSTGLVLCALLAWKVEEGGGPPLPCIVSSLQNAEKNQKRQRRRQPEVQSDPLFDRSIALLLGRDGQGQVDDDLRQLKSHCMRGRDLRPAEVRATNAVWELIGKMLQVDPDKRISIGDALTELGPILTRLSGVVA